MTRELPPFLRAMIDSPPRAGEGVHKWLYRVARQLHAHLPASEIIALLETRVAQCGRVVPQSEIIAAVQNSVAAAWQPKQNGTVGSAHPRWPTVNQEQREAIIQDGYGLADLLELSPVCLEDNESHPEEIIDRLFPPDSLLCCGYSQQEFDTRPREVWRGSLAKMSLIVPSPMSSITGITKNGRKSTHTLDNTGPRRFLVCEFDQGTTDEQAALLLNLGTFAPLVCVVHSGGKSLHGWFYVFGQPEVKIEKFFRYAVSIGADPATWTRSQFVRMPDGTREKGDRQTVFFLNFKPLEVSI